jgi:hypothetical protein
MGYVVYNVGTTRIETEKRLGKEVYATESAAKAARTRILKKTGYDETQLAVAELTTYRTLIEQMVKRVNLMSGKEYYESVNTPNYCSPASESYWSM